MHQIQNPLIGTWHLINLLSHNFLRRVAQPGSALLWGSRGRGFKSRHADEKRRVSRYYLVVGQTLSPPELHFLKTRD